MSTETTERVRAILRRDNITEASGEWSAFDIARELDPEAHKPRDMFDTKAPYPRAEYIAQAEQAIGDLGISGRYVGGTSEHLYSVR